MKKDIYSGKFVKKQYSFTALLMLSITVIIGRFVMYTNVHAVEPLLSPVPESGLNSLFVTNELATEGVEAGQPSNTPAPSVSPKTEEEEIIEYIHEVFKEDGNDAVKIAKCESRYNPEIIGDTHIMSYNNGELVGDSIGIFQVRTGGTNWNRAKANNMTAEEFRTYLKDYKNNIDYAKTIYDRSGWSAWYNCMNKEL